MTNADAARRHGLPPQLDDGSFITLHHLAQDSRGPLVEAKREHNKLSSPVHRQWGRGKRNPQHPVDHEAFQYDSAEYWRWRADNP
jgi:hypothetical protein